MMSKLQKSKVLLVLDRIVSYTRLVLVALLMFLSMKLGGENFKETFMLISFVMNLIFVTVMIQLPYKKF